MQKQKLLLVFVIAIVSLAAKAQTPEDSVKTVITQLFTAMKSGDAAGLSRCFADSAILQTIVDKNGVVSVRTENVKEFVDFVGTQKQGDADERIEFGLVRADGPLATAWTPYNFYYKGSFSHCGIDSYQLVRINGEWKIQYLVDTRHKTGCAQ